MKTSSLDWVPNTNKSKNSTLFGIVLFCCLCPVPRGQAHLNHNPMETLLHHNEAAETCSCTFFSDFKQFYSTCRVERGCVAHLNVRYIDTSHLTCYQRHVIREVFYGLKLN